MLAELRGGGAAIGRGQVESHRAGGDARGCQDCAVMGRRGAGTLRAHHCYDRCTDLPYGHYD